MKLVFAHDHIFYKYNNKFYSTGGLSKEMLERYTNVFEEVVVLSRQKELDKFNNNLTLASTDNVKFIEVPNFKNIKNIYKLKEAKNIINEEIIKSDAIISRLPSSIGSLAVISAKKYKKPYLIEMVACAWDALWNHSKKGKVLAPYEFLKTKKLVANSLYTLYVTNKFLQSRYPSKGETVNCSNVVLKDFDESILRERLNKISMKTDRDKFVIGTIGAVNVKYKGQQFIIKALAKLKKQGISNVEYQLVGSGNNSYLKSLAKKLGVSENVVFLGSMPHDQIFDWLRSIDLYSQPSRQEGLPRALIEAMSMGVPAFGARTAGIPELIASDYIFSNSNKKNVNEIISILNLFNNKKVLIEQAKRNFNEAKKYEKKIIEKRRKDFFLEFINSIKKI